MASHIAGERNGLAKLTERDVVRIRKEIKFEEGRGFSPPGAVQRVAEELNITPSTVRAIVRRERWQHLA